MDENNKQEQTQEQQETTTTELTLEQKFSELQEKYNASVKERDLYKDSLEKQKKATDNASSEAAEWKKKYRDTLSDAERAAIEKQETEKSLQEQLAQYKAKEQISNYKSKLLEIGYSADIAEIMAKELPSGMPESFFEGQKAFIEQQKAKAISDNLQKQPSLTPGEKPKPAQPEDAFLAAALKAAHIKS